ncbi:MAG: DUF2848 domain-containing protein [Gammaproteobacteria bacterium]|nr:DUF2848 domain-containing protein [Gammaproteobacteria bacterium]
MSSALLDLTLITGSDRRTRPTRFLHLAIAGWTARDTAAAEAHVRELESLGVPRPATTPVYYRVSAARLTTDARIEVLGNGSSGEAECVIACLDGSLWVGIGSDHTDRDAEATGVTLSKQMCDKPIGSEFWLFDEVVDHWDDLELRAHVLEGAQRRLYQQGRMSAILRPETLLEKSPDWVGQLRPEAAMFCGTLPAIGGVRSSSRFEMELIDPVRRRSLHHMYEAVPLPVRG